MLLYKHYIQSTAYDCNDRSPYCWSVSNRIDTWTESPVKKLWADRRTSTVFYRHLPITFFVVSNSKLIVDLHARLYSVFVLCWNCPKWFTCRSQAVINCDLIAVNKSFCVKGDSEYIAIISVKCNNDDLMAD